MTTVSERFNGVGSVLSELRKKFESNQGQQFLIRYLYEDLRDGCIGIVAPPVIAAEDIRTRFFDIFGVAKEPYLELKKSREKVWEEFKTNEYLTVYSDNFAFRKGYKYYGGFSFDGWGEGKEERVQYRQMFFDGFLRINSNLLPYIGNDIPKREMGILNKPEAFSELKRGLHFFVGNKDVMSLFEKDSWGRPVLDESYAQALEILGLEAPENFRKVYQGKILAKKFKIVAELLTNLEKEKTLDKRIENIYSSISQGGMIEGGAITPLEDEDDALVVSLGSRERSREARSEVESLLKRALELKMNKDDIDIPEIFPGVPIKMSDFITGLCRSYKIDSNAKEK